MVICGKRTCGCPKAVLDEVAGKAGVFGMIVYNVKRRWFTTKNDAEAYRRAEGLPTGSTFKLELGDREGLAGLLNELVALEGEPVPAPKTPT